jgi:hypothetical protein
MTPQRKRNLYRAPLVILIRVPIMLPLWALVHVGEWAEALGSWLSLYLPGFEREPKP